MVFVLTWFELFWSRSSCGFYFASSVFRFTFFVGCARQKMAVSVSFSYFSVYYVGGQFQRPVSLVRFLFRPCVLFSSPAIPEINHIVVVHLVYPGYFPPRFVSFFKNERGTNKPREKAVRVCAASEKGRNHLRSVKVL